MLNSSRMSRTTISLPEEILFELKKKALMERKKIKDVISEGLSFFLRYNTENALLKHNLEEPEDKKYKVDKLFGSWGKGKKGGNFVNELRKSRVEKRRDTYLRNLWKKS